MKNKHFFLYTKYLDCDFNFDDFVLFHFYSFVPFSFSFSFSFHHCIQCAFIRIIPCNSSIHWYIQTFDRGVLFTFLFPILQCTCFYLAIGDNPKSLKLGIVNEEVPNWHDCYNSSLITAQVRDYECNLSKISCRYLKEISPELAKQVLNVTSNLLFLRQTSNHVQFCYIFAIFLFFFILTTYV